MCLSVCVVAQLAVNKLAWPSAGKISTKVDATGMAGEILLIALVYQYYKSYQGRPNYDAINFKMKIETKPI